MDRPRMHELVVGSEDLIPLVDLDRYAAVLDEALRAAGVGSVGVRAGMPEPDEWGLRTTIRVAVSDLEGGVRVLRRTLRSAGVPDATWIWQWEPELVTYEIWGFSDDAPPSWGW